MRKPIVVVGSINLDLVATADHVPLPGETIIGKDFRTFHGGKGANQAVGVARLGYPVSMLGNIGDDSFGSALKNALRHAGVGVKFRPQRKRFFRRRAHQYRQRWPEQHRRRPRRKRQAASERYRRARRRSCAKPA